MSQAGGSVNPAVKGSPIFHDFLGATRSSESPADAPTDASAPRRLLRQNSDLSSDKQVVLFEGVPCYGKRDELKGPDIIRNRISGIKRGSTDSMFNGLLREQHQVSPLESLHLMKSSKNGGGSEFLRKPSSPDEFCFGIQPQAPSSVSHILQQSSSGRHESGVSRWDRSSVPSLASPAHRPQPSSHPSSLMNQEEPSRMTRENSGGLFMSQAVADEGSRTGVKRYGVTGISQSPISVNPNKANHCSHAHASLPETETCPFLPTSHGVYSSISRQMTIFYGGQAHVFDDVHPNKADVIMALAGSNGGSWSTTYSPMKAAALMGGGCTAAAAEKMMARPVLQELCRKPMASSSSSSAELLTDSIPTSDIDVAAAAAN